MRTVVLTSDISGQTPADTVRFGYAGVEYEIDLTPDERQGLLDALAPFLDAARAYQGGAAPKRQGFTSAEVRAWAKAKGFDVPDKGRVPKSVVAEFIDAHAT